MTFRPGARLARRPLHVVFLLDGSGSMAQDGKIDALNRAMRETLPHLSDLGAQNAFADLLVRAVVFADGARWHVSDPTPPEDLAWLPVSAGGLTDLGAALVMVSETLRVPPMDARAFPPVLVLVSDGRPTDDFEVGLARLMAEPWGRRAVRLAISVGDDADPDVLSAFIDDPTIPPFSAQDPEQLAYLVRFASTAASQAASVPAGTSHAGIPAPQPPAAAPTPGVLQW